MCKGEDPFPTAGVGPGYVAAQESAKSAYVLKDPIGGHTFEQSLRRRRNALQERMNRIGQKVQLLNELLRVFEED
jgi:hypothetical protein